MSGIGATGAQKSGPLSKVPSPNKRTAKENELDFWPVPQAPRRGDHRAPSTAPPWPRTAPIHWYEGEQKNATEGRPSDRMPFKVFAARPIDRRGFPPSIFPSWASLLVQSSMRPAGTALLWVTRSHFAVCQAARPSGLPDRPSQADVLVSTYAPLFEFRCPPGPFPDGASRRCAPFDAVGDAFPGLWFPLTRAACEVRPNAGFACPPASAPRVWLPSRRLTPSRASPTLFRVGSACGIRPSERSPLPRSAGVVHRLRPAYRYSGPPLPPAEAADRPPHPQFGFRVLPRESPLRVHGGFSPAHHRMLPWVFPSQGSCAPALAEISLRLLPRASATRAVTRPIRPCAPESPSTSGLPGPKVGHPSQGFCAAFLPALGVRPGPGYVFTSRPTACHHADHKPLLGPHRSLPELSGGSFGADPKPPISGKQNLPRTEDGATRILLADQTHNRLPSDTMRRSSIRIGRCK
jgi:hypothetical protein